MKVAVVGPRRMDRVRARRPRARCRARSCTPTRRGRSREAAARWPRYSSQGSTAPCDLLHRARRRRAGPPLAGAADRARCDGARAEVDAGRRVAASSTSTRSASGRSRCSATSSAPRAIRPEDFLDTTPRSSSRRRRRRSGGDAAGPRARGRDTRSSPRSDRVRSSSTRWSAAVKTTPSATTRATSTRRRSLSSPPRARSVAGRSPAAPTAPRRSPAPWRTPTAAETRSTAALTFALARGDDAADAVALAARCGAAVMTGRGPYEGQLTGAEV